VALRERILDGTAFLMEGVAADGANRLRGASVVTISPAPEEPTEEPVYGAPAREAVPWS
jgi:hypothetical protein